MGWVGAGIGREEVVILTVVSCYSFLRIRYLGRHVGEALRDEPNNECVGDN